MVWLGSSLPALLKKPATRLAPAVVRCAPAASPYLGAEYATRSARSLCEDFTRSAAARPRMSAPGSYARLMRHLL
eukprot:7827202-Lingulodinium_polyedra.AAC.1